MMCANCHEREGRPYTYAIGRRTTELCGQCWASLVRIGMDLHPVERRSTDLPVLKERRHFSPPWLARLRAKDMTERAA